MDVDALTSSADAEEGRSQQKLAVLLAMAMFVLVVDTSMMNVSITAVVEDLGATVSDVQSAIALEALVSAAFILIASKVGDLIGRKRAYVMGLVAYAIGALAMTLAQSMAAVIVFWAIVGGLGASLLLPAMQSLIHGNFEGAAHEEDLRAGRARRWQSPRRSGRSSAASSRRTCRGGSASCWRSSSSSSCSRTSGSSRTSPTPGTGKIDTVGAGLSVLGMGGVVLGILVWQEGGDYVGLLIAIGALALAVLAWWLVRRHREGQATLLDPDLFGLKNFRTGITGQMLQNITLGGAMIALPIFLQIKLEYDAMQAGLSLAPLSLTMFAVALLAGEEPVTAAPPASSGPDSRWRWSAWSLIIPVDPRRPNRAGPARCRS